MKKWHSKNPEEVIEELKSSFDGLADSEVNMKIKEHGENKLPEKKSKSKILVFINQFKSPLIAILIFAGLIALFIHEYVDAIVVFVILILNSCISFWQEYKAERDIAALKMISTKKAKVIRNGKAQIIDAIEIVPGDIIHLAAGDKIPADIRLIESASFRVDESILTGESVSVTKNHETYSHDTHILEAKNIAFSGTLVIEGRAKGIVVETGIGTEIGKIATKVQKETKEQTPLQKRLDHLGNTLGKISVVLVIPVVLLGFIQGRETFEIFELAVSLAVSAVPEGLPIIVTIGLALSVKKMLKSKALIRTLPVVEVLGNADVICTDKTGTITTNKITVREIYFKNKKYLFNTSADGRKTPFFKQIKYDQWELKGKEYGVEEDFDTGALNDFLTKAILCSDATLEIGDPTEQALVVAADKKRIKIDEARKVFKRSGEIPFSSEYKYMVTENENMGVVLKGATEQVILRCDRVVSDGNTLNLTEAEKIEIIKLNEQLSEQGKRVLALGYKERNGQKLDKNNLNGFVFCGLIAMIDPPRAEVPAAINACYSAGVRVIMITGDHALTAKAIADEVGIKSNGVITGNDLEKIDEKELKRIVEEISIFARVTSNDKLRILKALQSNGHVVGMGGDGINDTPAIKKAQLGFSVGTGTDLAKEVADMILLDDNFATIPKAIKEGRTVFQNIRNFIKLLLSSNFDEVLIVLTSLLLGLPLFFQPIHILFINLLSDGLPATSLATDVANNNIMARKPFSIDKPIYSGLLPFIVVAGLLAYFAAFLIFAIAYPWWLDGNTGETLIKAQSMVFATAVAFELVLVFICRTKNFAFGKSALDNKYLIVAVIISFIILMLALYVPFLNTALKTIPLNLVEWATILSIVGVSTSLLELFKIRYYGDRDF